MQHPRQLRCVAYARAQGRNAARDIQRQFRTIDRYGSQHNLSIVARYFDIASANDATRVGLRAVRGRLQETPRVAIVIVDGYSRLVRDLAVFVRLLSFFESHKAKLIVAAPSNPLDTVEEPSQRKTGIAWRESDERSIPSNMNHRIIINQGMRDGTWIAEDERELTASATDLLRTILEAVPEGKSEISGHDLGVVLLRAGIDLDEDFDANFRELLETGCIRIARLRHRAA